MHPPERPHTHIADIVAMAMADQVADAEVDEETDARSTNANTAKCTIIPPKHVGKESMLKEIQIPPGTMSVHATTAVLQDTSKPSASTSNVPRINATRSTKAQHLPGLLQQEIAM